MLNQRRVFAVPREIGADLRRRRPAIPFYMQPSLGGSEDLRGYRPFRFRGDNLLAMNAEYRWEVFSGLDMAVFADAGKVFTRKSDFSLRRPGERRRVSASGSMHAIRPSCGWMSVSATKDSRSG